MAYNVLRLAAVAGFLVISCKDSKKFDFRFSGYGKSSAAIAANRCCEQFIFLALSVIRRTLNFLQTLNQIPELYF